jgi:NAD(P)-dependent dehydrogenase (short-subunit alcohol dehydrogenase family)
MARLAGLETVMSHRLSGKVCVITGSGGSIGRAACVRFASEGAVIVGCDINSSAAQDTVTQVQAAGGEMLSVHPCDLTNTADCERLMKLTIDTHGGIDVLYNNAAMAYFGWMTEMTPEMFMRTVVEELNIVFLLSRVAWPHLVKRGKASIINTASAAAHQPNAVVPGVAHSSAKAGVWSMTRQLAMEGGKYQVRANSISPGPVVSNQTKAYLEDPQFWSVMGQKIMLGRPGQPDDIANCAVFLASDESSWITGADIRVDGGMTAW